MRIWLGDPTWLRFDKVRLTNQRPLPSLEEVRAIMREAHRLDRRVTVHTDVPANDAVQLAIDAGVDGIEHNAPLRAGDAVLRQMATKHIYLGTAGAGGFYVQAYTSGDPATMVESPARSVLPHVAVSALEKAAVALQQQTAKMKSEGWNARGSAGALHSRHAAGARSWSVNRIWIG